MVLYVIKWDILPGMDEAYQEWAKKATEMSLKLPGVIEFRAFRSLIGGNQVCCTYEFNDMETWASWLANEEFQNHFQKGREYWTNMSQELYGPSPIVPKPIRP